MQPQEQPVNVYVTDPATINHVTPANALKILQINIHGMNQMEKFDSLCEFVHSLDIVVDVLVIGETCIKEERTKFYNIAGYKSTWSCRRTSAGGLAIFVRSDLQSEVKKNTIDQGYHHIQLKVKTSTQSAVTVHGIYRPPDYDAAHLSSFLEEFFAAAEPDAPMFIIGDMNLPVNQPLNRDVQRYVSLLNSYNMTVSNNIITRPSSNNILDHVVCGIADSLRVSNYTMDCAISDHSYVLTILNLRTERVKKTLTKTWTNYGEVNEHFQSFLESLRFETMSANDRLQALTTKYRQLVEDHSRKTVVNIKVKANYCPWYNFDMWKWGKIRDNVLRRYRQSNQNEDLRNLLAHVNQRLAATKRNAKQAYYSSIFNSSNPKQLWRRIHGLLGGKSKTTDDLVLEQNHLEVREPALVGNVMNEYFTNVASNLASTLTSDGDVNKFNTMRFCNRTIFLRPVSAVEVENIISTLEVNKACGHDGFPVAALKIHRTLLSIILTDCFNDCISEGTYPECLKKALVIPVFKSGDRKNPANY